MQLTCLGLPVLRPKPSAGHDGISVKLLKHLTPALVTPLTIVINQSLLTGIVPDKIKVAKVLPQHKKDNTENMNNYRPVSLLNAFSKVFEKIVFFQLYDYFKDNKLLYNGQYGFRKDHSTELATMELIDRALSEIDRKNCAIAVFMDLSKAFDTLDHKILIKKLHYYGVRDKELEWFTNYLNNRWQYVELDNVKSQLLELQTGVPLGSILGPLLFLIYINDLPMATENFEYILYADDSTLFSATDQQFDINALNNSLEEVYNWLATNKLSLNIDKTKCVVLRAINKNVSHIPDYLTIQNTNIGREKSFNLLGVVIDEHLNWKSHTDKIANKISKNIGVLNQLKHYLPMQTLRTLYCSMIQTHLNYGNLAWGIECNRLNKLQKRAIRTICLSKYNDHTEGLFKERKLLKFSDLVLLNSLKFFYKYKHKTLPEYFSLFNFTSNADQHDHDTRHGDIIPANVTRIQQTQNCIRHKLHKTINDTSTELLERINNSSLQSFAIAVKKEITAQYMSVCRIENCYICNRNWLLLGDLFGQNK